MAGKEAPKNLLYLGGGWPHLCFFGVRQGFFEQLLFAKRGEVGHISFESAS